MTPSARVVDSVSRKRATDFRAFLKSGPTLVVNQADPPPQLGEPKIRVIMAQHQTILGTAGEHAIRLVHSACDQIVDQDSDIRLRAIEHERRLRS